VPIAKFGPGRPAKYLPITKQEVIAFLCKPGPVRCMRCPQSCECCQDLRVLQIDHKEGGGSKELRRRGSNSRAYLHHVMQHPQDYQVLCANCNWRKKYDREEVRGPAPHYNPVAIAAALAEVKGQMELPAIAPTTPELKEIMSPFDILNKAGHK
jgi:hypothetical protein